MTKRQLQVIVNGYNPDAITDEVERSVARVCEVFYQDAEDAYEPTKVSDQIVSKPNNSGKLMQ